MVGGLGIDQDLGRIDTGAGIVRKDPPDSNPSGLHPLPDLAAGSVA